MIDFIRSNFTETDGVVTMRTRLPDGSVIQATPDGNGDVRWVTKSPGGTITPMLKEGEPVESIKIVVPCFGVPAFTGTRDTEGNLEFKFEIKGDLFPDVGSKA